MTTFNDPLNQYSWWSSLKHGGMLISPARLANYFPAERPNIPRYLADRLRTAVQAQQNSDSEKVQPTLLDTVLEDVLRLKSDQWAKATNISPSWGQRLITGENLRPRRLWQGPYNAVLKRDDSAIGETLMAYVNRAHEGTSVPEAPEAALLFRG